MRKGQLDVADGLAKLISKSIINNNSTMLADKGRGTKDLWTTVNKILGKSENKFLSSSDLNAQQLNDHFGKVSTDGGYIAPLRKDTVCNQPVIFKATVLFKHFDKLKATSPGLDDIPFWFLRLAAPFISLPLSYMFNNAINQSIVPAQ